MRRDRLWLVLNIAVALIGIALVVAAIVLGWVR
jgi:hypothetical protein